MSLFSAYNGMEASPITGDWLVEQGFKKDWNPVTRKIDYYKLLFADADADKPIWSMPTPIGMLHYNTKRSYFSLTLEKKRLNDDRYQYISVVIKTRLQVSMLIDDIMKNYKDLANGIINPMWEKKRLMK